MAQPAAQKRTPLGIAPFWEKPSSDLPLKWEKCQIQAKVVKRKTNTRTDLQKHNSRIFRPIGTRKERAAENEVGKLLPMTIKNWSHAWWQTLEPSRSKNRFYIIPQPWNRRKEDCTHPQPASEDGYIDHC